MTKKILLWDENISFGVKPRFYIKCLSGGLEVKNPPARVGDAGNVGLIPGWGRSPGGGNGNPLQYSCPENPVDRGTWRATVHGVAESQIRLSMHTACTYLVLC